ncbi:hypothetical protein ASA1KI_07060 [Opitutales bacterium ASA1]|uniref:hypothetical protein n=1 Tax=Congregicoccus parvus TaxID=3081749 RepID=UPI002B28AA9E|nr:hypothetical protein ASA1KI_07060 [Opitutales bacterium ASA1]
MNNLVRPLLSGAVFVGLFSFFCHALASTGVSSERTIFAFSLLTLHGLLEVAVASYAPSSRSRTPVRLRASEQETATAPVARAARIPVSTTQETRTVGSGVLVA